MPNGPEYMAVWLGITRAGGVVACSTRICRAVRSPIALISSGRAHYGRARAVGRVHRCARAPDHGAQGMATRRRRRRFSEHRARARPVVSREISAMPSAIVRRLRSRALDLHFGHDRSAQGRKRQPSSVAHVEPLVRGHDETSPSDRMYNCLPMYHSIGGSSRPGQCWSTEARSDSRQILRQSLLGGCCALGLHVVPVYRRAVPLSRAGAPASPRARPSDQIVLRQCGARISGKPSRTNSTFPHPGVLCVYRGQCHLVQLRGQAGRYRYGSRHFSHTAPPLRWSGLTSTKPMSFGMRRGAASVVFPMSRGKRLEPRRSVRSG